MKMKFVFLALAAIFASGSWCSKGFATGTELGNQIATSNFVLHADQSPYLLTGKVQIPAPFTLTIESGVSIIVNGGSFVTQGNAYVGKLNSAQVLITSSCANQTGSFITLLTEGSTASISNAVFKKECPESSVSIHAVSFNGDYVSSNLSITNSTLDGWYWSTRDMHNFEFSNNLVIANPINQYDNDRYGEMFPDSINGGGIGVVKGNVFVNLRYLTLPGRVYSYSFEFSSNYFINNDSTLSIEHAGNSGDHYIFKNNIFTAPNNIKFPIYQGSGVIDYSGNYWKGAQTASQIRALSDIHDGLTDIQLAKINFDPILQSQPSLTPIMEKYLLQIAAAADKAAADKAAADKAAADKAAADKAAADKAAAIQSKAPTKLATATCMKGKKTLKVIGYKPKCPAGFTLKK